MSDQKPYLCPVCKGRQVVSNEFYVGRDKTIAEMRELVTTKMLASSLTSAVDLWGFDSPAANKAREDAKSRKGMTDEEKEEARILHSDVECRTCGGKGVVIV